MAKKRWIAETIFERDGFRMEYEADRVLHEVKTKHQDLVLFQNKFFGKMLMLDGATQVTSRDEFVYHEMMSHMPLFAHGKARNVLIVGGGDCGIAEEVLKHKTVKSLTHVEIDESVIEFSKKHFPEFTRRVFRDKRYNLVIDDGMKFVKETDQLFDVIIVDSTDPQGPGGVLFTREFYAGCKRCMAPGAVMVTQNGVPFYQPRELRSSVKYFRRLFDDAYCFVAPIPTYIGGHMAMGWASKNPAMRKLPVSRIATRYNKAGAFKTQYWTPEVHVAAFALPRFIADIVGTKKA